MWDVGMVNRARILAALLLLACGCEKYTTSGSGQSTLHKRVLYDFRVIHPPPTANRWSEAQGRALFAWRKSNRASCLSEPVSYVHSIEGSLIGPDKKEVGYLMSGGCLSQVAGTNALVVFDGDNLIDVYPVRADQLLLAADVDADGTDEIVTDEIGIGSGITRVSASLIRLEGNKLRLIEEFGVGREDTCGSQVVPRAITAAVIYYLPPSTTEKVHFSAEVYRAECPKESSAPVFTRVEGK